MTDHFRGFRCWSPAEVQSTIFGDIASLGLDADAVFLAAHTSLAVRRAKGAAQQEASPELEMLHSLTQSIGRVGENSIIAVTGPSGSGKSHLVRWIRAHLDERDDRCHVVYVPRELASLRDLINRVLDGLPASGEVEQVRRELDRAMSRKTIEQLSEELLDRVRSVVAFELADGGPGSERAARASILGERDAASTRRRNGLADLLLVPAIRQHVLRDDGAVRNVVTSLSGQRSGGDERTPEFTEHDVQIRAAGVEAGMSSTMRRVWQTVQRNPAIAVAMLNEVLPRAVAETLGMGPGANLGEVFRSTRRRLRSEGKDLVLLFEDLAQFGLFDGELFDQFVLQPGEQLAPIRAVFAITDGKFRESVPDTVRTRLSHHFEVGTVDLRSPEMEEQVVELTSKYLNVARLGRGRVTEAWATSGPEAREDGSWVPSACWDDGAGRECHHRTECWAAFGQAGEAGLYPYNRTALLRALRGFRGPVTPRVLVDEVVHDFLLEAWAEIGSATFPSDRMRSRFDFSVTMPKEVVVPTRMSSDLERDRLHRARVIWADGAMESETIRDAFGLLVADGADTADAESSDSSSAMPSQEVPPPRPQPLIPFFEWEMGTPLPSAQAVFFREFLFQLLLSRIDFDSMLISRGDDPADRLISSIVANNSFEFTAEDPGRRVGKGLLSFAISPNSEGVRILSAARWFADHGHWWAESPERRWDFVGDLQEARITFDEFLCACAESVESRLRSDLYMGAADPSSAVVMLRTVSLLALGHQIDSESADVLERVLGGAAAGTPSVEWRPVAEVARAILRTLDTSWISSFASCRQGETGEPLVIDAHRLRAAVRKATHDPLEVLATDRPFGPAFSELSALWNQMRDALHRCVPSERSNLEKLASDVRLMLGGEEPTELSAAAATAGRLAVDSNLFRPHNRYDTFRSACDELGRSDLADAARKVVDSVPSTASSDVAFVLRAQEWASGARDLLGNLQAVKSCLSDTLENAQSLLEQEVGESPDLISDRIVKRLQDIEGMLDALKKRGSR